MNEFSELSKLIKLQYNFRCCMNVVEYNLGSIHPEISSLYFRKNRSKRTHDNEVTHLINYYSLAANTRG